MGGNALKNVETTRKNKEDYEQIKTLILKIAKSCPYIDQIQIVHEIPGKMDFGDLDVLYTLHQNAKGTIQDWIKENIKPNEMVKNGTVLSFDFQQFQIDFIHVQNLEMASFYFGYGDVGAILGRIVNAIGLKFGEHGLWLNLLEQTIDENKDITQTTNLGKIILTNDPKEVCNFLKLDYEKLLNRFSNKIEIYEWICTTKYFNPNIFLHLNYEHRSRMDKRPFYRDFLEWIGIKKSDVQQTNCEHSGEIYNNCQKEAIQYFKKEKEVEELCIKKKEKEQFREKWNGHIFLSYGLKEDQKKKLNKIIQECVKEIQKKIYIDFEKWILNETKEKINKEIEQFLKNFNYI